MENVNAVCNGSIDSHTDVLNHHHLPTGPLFHDGLIVQQTADNHIADIGHHCEDGYLSRKKKLTKNSIWKMHPRNDILFLFIRKLRENLGTVTEL